MNKPIEQKTTKTVDSIQENIAQFADKLTYDRLSPEAIHAAKVRLIDTLAALLGGFYGDTCQIARNLAAQMPNPNGSTVVGTRIKTTPDLAAFVNGTTARYAELADAYHWPGSYQGHPSDVVMPILGVAEHVHATGSELINAIVLGYEVSCRVCDVFHNEGFDHTIFNCLGSAVASGKLLGLSRDQLAHCISMAVVPNNILRQARTAHQSMVPLSMFKVTASGHAARAGVFAALLARAGMEGPHLPFEGKAGWCEHIARERFELRTWGGNGVRFKILDSQIKNRPAAGTVIASILAAEKIGPLKNVKGITKVIVEIHKKGKQRAATGEHRWNPETKGGADGSIPYCTAAALMDGTMTPRSYNDAHLWNPELRGLMQKIEVVENDEFTKAYQRLPQEHHCRVTVITRNGERMVGTTGGDADDLAMPKSDAQIAAKFRGLGEELLGTKRVDSILESLWNLESARDTASVPAALILD